MSWFPRSTNRQAGFTLIEMIVVIVIMTIMTAVILSNLPAFRSKTELDLIAQEVAITTRQAQVYSSSNRGGGTLSSYGLHFEITPNAKSVYLFKDIDGIRAYDSSLACTSNPECVERFDLRGGIAVAQIDLCQTTASCSPSPSTDILFKYPEMEADLGGNSLVRINLVAQNYPANVRTVNIWSTGFIEVK